MNSIATGIKADVFEAARYSPLDFYGNPVTDTTTAIHGHDFREVTDKLNEIARECIDQDGAQYDSYSFMAYGLQLVVERDYSSRVKHFVNGVEVPTSEWDVKFA